MNRTNVKSIQPTDWNMVQSLRVNFFSICFVSMCLVNAKWVSNKKIHRERKAERKVEKKSIWNCINSEIVNKNCRCIVVAAVVVVVIHTKCRWAHIIYGFGMGKKTSSVCAPRTCTFSVSLSRCWKLKSDQIRQLLLIISFAAHISPLSSN